MYYSNSPVKDGVAKPKGKYPEALGNVVIIEFELWNQLVREGIKSMVQQVQDGIIAQLSVIPGLSSLIPTLIPQNFTDMIEERTNNLKMEVHFLGSKEG